MCVFGAICVVCDFYNTWSVPIPATVRLFKWDEEKYRLYRELYTNHGHQLGDMNKLTIMLHLRKNYEEDAWVEDSTYELLDYKRFNATNLVPVASRFAYLEYESRDEKQQWRVFLQLDRGANYAREYDTDYHVLVFIARILIRIFIQAPFNMIGLIGLALPNPIGISLIAASNLNCHMIEVIMLGTLKFAIAWIRLLCALIWV